MKSIPMYLMNASETKQNSQILSTIHTIKYFCKNIEKSVKFTLVRG